MLGIGDAGLITVMVPNERSELLPPSLSRITYRHTEFPGQFVLNFPET